MMTEILQSIADELASIKHDAEINKGSDLRLGQVIFNTCRNKFPSCTRSIANEECSCFYDDSKIDIFLERLKYALFASLTD